MSDKPLPMWADTHSAARARYVAPLQERPPAPIIEAPIVDVAGAWDAKPTVQEVGTPIHRSVATLIRSAPVVLLLIVLGAPISWWAVGGWDWVWAVAIMGGLGLAGTLGVLLLDLQYNSPSSTERHRIDRAAQLKRQELKQTHELRRAVIEAWIERWGGDS